MDRHSSTKGHDKDKDSDLTKEPALINSSNSASNGNGLLYISNRPIRFRTGFRNTIYDAMKKRNWKDIGSSHRLESKDNEVLNNGNQLTSNINNNNSNLNNINDYSSGNSNNWDIMWNDKDIMFDVFDNKHLESNQRVNHFRNCRELCRKDLLIKNLKRVRRQIQKTNRTRKNQQNIAGTTYGGSNSSNTSINGEGESSIQNEEGDNALADYNFWPTSFFLPADYALFSEEFKKKALNNNIWIMKPIGKAQGKGIFIFSKLSQISKWKSESRWGKTGIIGNAVNCGKDRDSSGNHDVSNISSNPNSTGKNRNSGDDDDEDVESYVVQKYINNPLLIGGRKFDIRLYVLVTSFNPLTVWIYRSGFCRFTTYRYSNATASISNNLMHLTNVAIQKKSDQYDSSDGGKWGLRELKLYLMSQYGVSRIDQLYYNIQKICIKCLEAVQPVMIADKHCFELYGYDILIDDNLKPWLIEVNASPSLSANTPADYQMKVELLTHTFDVLDLEGKLYGDEIRVGGFDLIYKGCNLDAKNQQTNGYKTMLGTEIPKDVPTKRRKSKHHSNTKPIHSSNSNKVENSTPSVINGNIENGSQHKDNTKESNHTPNTRSNDDESIISTSTSKKLGHERKRKEINNFRRRSTINS